MEQGKGAQRFRWMQDNPNDQCGGGGCACSEKQVEDRSGPFKVFYNTDMADPFSIHNVVCAPCAGGPPADLELTANPYETITVQDATEIVQPPERDENPVSDEWDIPAI